MDRGRALFINFAGARLSEVRNNEQCPGDSNNPSFGGCAVPSRVRLFAQKALRRKGVRDMEQLSKGLALEELEAHSFAQLLPDRIEMRSSKKKRRRSGNVECKATNVAGLLNLALNAQACSRINA